METRHDSDGTQSHSHKGCKEIADETPIELTEVTVQDEDACEEDSLAVSEKPRQKKREAAGK